MHALKGEADWSWPDRQWLRANMVTTLDGAATGSDGLSGTINNEADKRVFRELREGADAIIVGAGTARAENYGGAGKPLIVIGHSLTPKLEDADHVRLHPGGDAEALRELIADLHAEGLTKILTEGGPSLLGNLLRAGLVDEMCITVTPQLIAGTGRRIVSGELNEVDLELVAVVESDSTLITRWLVSPRDL